MKTFDELLAMTDEARLEYLEAEVSEIIENAPPQYQLKLRALHAKCNGIRRNVHNPLVRAQKIYDMMIDSLENMNDSFQPIRGFSRG